MNLLAPISSIMTQELITVGPYDTMKTIEEIFERKNIHHIPVVQSEKIVGMVSKSDYLFFMRGFTSNRDDKRMNGLRARAFKATDIMTTGLAKMEHDEKVNIALEVFKENLFHAIPILKDDKLVGIVTTYDVIQHLADDLKVSKEYN